MHKTATVIALVIAITTVMAGQNNTPSKDKDNDRKVTLRVEPAYPELAKRMHLQGVVKVEAQVRANGSVKSTRVLGGNPVLSESATDAVSKWKFEPGSEETIEVVQLTFVQQ
jgi:TonB family protein